MSLALAAALAYADIVYLRSGEELEGTVLQETEEAVEIRLRDGRTLRVAREQVARIEYRELPEGEFERRARELGEAGAGPGPWEELAAFCREKGMALAEVRCLGEARRAGGDLGDRWRPAVERALRDGDAIEELADLAPDVPAVQEAMLARARDAWSARDVGAADRWLLAALRARPGWAEPTELRIRIYASLDEWSVVEAMLEESGAARERRELARRARILADRSERTVDQEIELAHACDAFGAPDRALERLRSAYDREPTADVARRLAEAHRAQGRLLDAYRVLERGPEAVAAERERLEWEIRYGDVVSPLDEATIAALRELEGLLERDDRRALAAHPLALVEAAIRRGGRWPAAEPGVHTFRTRTAVGDHEVEYVVYVPPGYHPLAAWPAVLTLHGSEGTGPQQWSFWRADMEACGEFIVVSPSASRFGWGFSRQGHSYALSALADAMRRYHVDPNRVYADGGSMGGCGAFELATRYPGTFAAIAPRVGVPLFARIDGGEPVPRLLENLSQTPIYWIVGELDDKVPIEKVREARDRMRRLDLPLTYREFAGRGHEWYPDEDEAVLAFYRANVRSRYPERVVYSTDETAFPRSGWVEIVRPAATATTIRRYEDREREVAEERDAFQPDARVTAEIDRARNSVRLRVTGVREARIYLHGDMVDLARPVAVVAGGRRVFEGRVEPSLAFLLDEVARTGDRERLYLAAVTVRLRQE